MNVRLRRAYDDPRPDDGVRVLVDRVWPRGRTKVELNLDRWARDIAPSTELRRWFGHEPGRWDEFRRRYQAELRERSQAAILLRDHGAVLFRMLLRVGWPILALLLLLTLLLGPMVDGAGV